MRRANSVKLRHYPLIKHPLEIKSLPPIKPPGEVDTIDKWIKHLVTDWKVNRAKQQCEWAEAQLANDWGYRDDPDPNAPNLEGLNKVQECEFHLAGLKPESITTAIEMLRVVTEIMAYKEHDPEHVFAQGPCLDIVRNVREALGFLPGTTRLRSSKLAEADASETIDGR